MGIIMYFIKSFLITRKKIKRKLEEAEQQGKEKERYVCDKEKQIEIIDLSTRYEKLLAKKDSIIKNLRKQHEDDIKAYKIYEDNLYVYKKECEELKELVQSFFSPILLVLQKTNERIDNSESMENKLREMKPKIQKLMRLN